MNKRVTVITVAILAVVGFAASGAIYNNASEDRQSQTSDRQIGTSGPQTQSPAPAMNVLVRPHSPVLGPQNAPVTIVEFFDPSCEACRAMYPAVKQIMAEHPNDVRLVLRYTPFHKGSEAAIRILEAARAQGVFVPVLEAVLAAQPEWHDDAQAGRAWDAAAAAGLDVQRARQTMMSPRITANLKQDVADVQAAGVTGTPTFFVNGKPLPSFGAEQLYELVNAEVAAAQ